MPSTWPSIRLGNHVDLITGFPFKSKRFTSGSGDIHLVKGENLQQGYIDWGASKKWPSSELKGHEKFLLQPGDVVLAMDRPWVPAGLKHARIRKGDPISLLVQRVARIRGSNGLLTSYLQYVIASPRFTDYIKPIVTGVNVPHISAKQIGDFTFLLPPEHTQKKIVNTISPYDDLITNNTRRIHLLEQLAKLSYDEWFVKFKFPGHEKVRMVSSELGEIPEGWEVKKLADLVEFRKGKQAKRVFEDQIGGSFPYLLIDGIRTGSHRYTDEKGIYAQRNNVIMVMDGASSGAVFIGQEGYVGSTLALIDIKDNSISPYFVLEFLISNFDRISSNNTGAAIPHASKDFINGLDVVIPKPVVREELFKIFDVLFGLKVNLELKNVNLRKSRDLLLPKLISGEIDVSNLDIKGPEVEM